MTLQSTVSVKTIIAALGYLYKTFCLTFLVIGVAKILSNDGSWINYFIIFSLLFFLVVIWHLIKKFTR
jgi:hypothetical protein